MRREHAKHARAAQKRTAANQPRARGLCPRAFPAKRRTQLVLTQRVRTKSARRSIGGRQLREQRLDLAEHVRFLVPEIVEVRVQRCMDEPQLVVGQFDRVHV